MKKVHVFLISFAVVLLAIFIYIGRHEIRCWLDKTIPVDFDNFVSVDYGDDDGGGSSRCEAWLQVKEEYIRIKEGKSSEVIAKAYMQQFGIGQFSMQKIFEDEKFAKYRIIPENTDHDIAQLYLKFDEGVWMVISGPGTAFPDLEKHYPELKGR